MTGVDKILCDFSAYHFIKACSKGNFTITEEIHAHSLVNFFGQYADRHMNLKFMRRVSEREREIRQYLLS